MEIKGDLAKHQAEPETVMPNETDELAPSGAVVAEENNYTSQELFEKHGLKAIIMLSAALLVSVSLNGAQTYFLMKKEREYFGTDRGYVFPIHPLNKPAYSSESVLDFANKTMVKAFALNFVNYENQLTSVRPAFTKSGYDQFRIALTKSGILKRITEKRLNLKMSNDPGSLITEGVITGTDIWAWRFKIPVTIQYTGQTQDYQPENLDLVVQIQQVDVSEDPQGIQITQVNLRPRSR
jgi:intracellular multiplication protein IcmL